MNGTIEPTRLEKQNVGHTESEEPEELKEGDEVCANCGEYKEAHIEGLCPSAKEYGKRFKKKEMKNE